MRLTLRAGDVVDERAVALAEDRVVLAEDGQERPLERGPAPPRPRGWPGSATSSGSVGTSRGNARAPAWYFLDGNGASYAARTSRPTLVTVAAWTSRPAGKTGVRVAKVRHARNASGSSVLGGGQEAVRDDDAGEPVGLLPRDPQPDERAPVLAEQRDVRQADEVHPAGHPVDVSLVGVVGDGGGLVGLAEPDQVGREHPVAGVDERRDHRAVEVAPGRLAVQQHHHGAVARPFVDVVHPEGAVLTGLDRGPVRLERVAGQIGEPLVGSTESMHDVTLGRPGRRLPRPAR